MGEIGSDTWGVDNIVQCQLGDERRGLEEKGQGLREEMVSRNCVSVVHWQATYPIPPEAPATTIFSSEPSSIIFLCPP